MQTNKQCTTICVNMVQSFQQCDASQQCHLEDQSYCNGLGLHPKDGWTVGDFICILSMQIVAIYNMHKII